jgi:hypothetical protein
MGTQESRILITIDTDFGQLVFLEGQPHSGLIRLPDVPSNERLLIIKDLIDRFSNELPVSGNHHSARRQDQNLDSGLTRFLLFKANTETFQYRLAINRVDMTFGKLHMVSEQQNMELAVRIWDWNNGMLR